MRRFLRRWVVPVVLALFAALPRASADDINNKDLHPGVNSGILPPPSAAPADAGDKPERPPPTLAYFLAVGSVIVVMCILCVPSRKAESSTARK